MLCDKRMKLRIKSKICKTVVRPPKLHVTEAWAPKKVTGRENECSQNMLRWSCRVTRLDRTKNDIMRGTTRVSELSKKAQEQREQCYEHVMRRGKD